MYCPSRKPHVAIHSTVPARSSTLPTRRVQCCSWSSSVSPESHASPFSSPARDSCPAGIHPGRMALQRISAGESDEASECVRPSRPAFLWKRKKGEDVSCLETPVQ